MVTSENIHELLAEAQDRVEILGVAGLDADWELLTDAWAKTFKKNSQFKSGILCESDNFLFSKSFISDTEKARTRRTFQELKFVRDRALDIGRLLIAAGVDPASLEQKKLKNGQSAKTPNFFVEIMHLAIPISVVRIDKRLFINVSLDEVSNGYDEITPDHEWWSIVDRYVQTYFDPGYGRKYAAQPETELLELFDHSRTPRGIFPRNSFYDTDYSQLVVWALIFDRQGRLLIHRRADNAKDNQGMWDKSVGGHADFSLDIDTSRAVVRELIEELYEDESRETSKFWAVTDDQMVYLGDWRPKERKQAPFREIRAFTKEWAFFRVRDSQHLYSPRTLGDGVIRPLRVIADVFLFVAGHELNEENLLGLKNSEFKLLTLGELKSAVEKSLRNEEVEGFDTKNSVPRFTPDLTNIMTGKLRDELEEFSQYVKRYAKR